MAFHPRESARTAFSALYINILAHVYIFTNVPAYVSMEKNLQTPNAPRVGLESGSSRRGALRLSLQMRQCRG